jgi:predicted O-methyltransferase YrrM
MHSLESENSEICREIEEEAIASYVPIIRKEMESFLKVMLTIKRPERILEVGAGIGYSSILMSEFISETAHITTIENYKKRIPIARENIIRAGKEKVISLIEGDATKILPEINETYDFIFMDAAKGQYINFLPDILRILNKGGILISDNVLQEGELIESRFAIERRNRTIHSRMREYLYALKHTPELETSIIPLGDGITLSVRKKEERE